MPKTNNDIRFQTLVIWEQIGTFSIVQTRADLLEVFRTYKRPSLLSFNHFFRLIIRPTLIQLHYTSPCSQRILRQTDVWICATILFSNCKLSVDRWKFMEQFTHSYLQLYCGLPKSIINLNSLSSFNKSSAVAETGDHARAKWVEKYGPAVIFPWGGASHHVTQCRLCRGLPPYQVASWSIQPCPMLSDRCLSCLSVSNLVCCGQTVWPQHTKVRDRQTGLSLT